MENESLNNPEFNSTAMTYFYPVDYICDQELCACRVGLFAKRLSNTKIIRIFII